MELQQRLAFYFLKVNTRIGTLFSSAKADMPRYPFCSFLPFYHMVSGLSTDFQMDMVITLYVFSILCMGAPFGAGKSREEIFFLFVFPPSNVQCFPV